MSARYIFSFVFLFSLSVASHAQGIATLSGYITDSKTGEALIGATVRVEGTEKGAVTNIEGYYEITGIAAQSYNVTANYVGYKQLTKFNIVVRSAGNPDLNFALEEAVSSLDDIVVVANPFDKLPETPLSIQSLSAEEIATYPGGNNDIAKVVQSLPGVSGSVGGFRNDVIIRGGAPNENVYYLDGVEIPNINHFSTQGSAGGPVGLLNVSFIEGVKLSTTAFHGRYDNPLSGVLQFDQRKGNDREFRGNVRISSSEAALTGEGTLFKGDKETAKTTYLLSVRRSYLQALFQVIGLPILPDYWDYQYKVNHVIDNYNELNFIGIGSLDDFSVKAPDEFDAEQQAILEQVPVINQWTTSSGLTWKNRFKDGSGYMQTTVSTNILNNQFNRYADNENETGLFFSNDSRETERKLRYEYTKFVGEWTLASGIAVQQALYTNNTLNNVDAISYLSDISFWKYGLFAQSSRSFFDQKLDFSFGMRADANTFTTQKNQLAQTLSPRVALSYVLDEARKWRLNGSVGRYYKIAPYTVLGFQGSTGTFENKNVDYIRSDHGVLGIEYLVTPSARFTVEGFVKRYSDYPVSIIDGVSLANKGAGFEVLGNEAVVSIGDGKTRGIEFLFQQKFNGDIYAIFAYTWFKSEFSGLTGEYLPSVWDSRHLLTFTGGYKFGNNWELGIRNRFIGRTPYVPVDEAATFANYPAVLLDYSRLGGPKLDIFNQLDVRIDKKWNFNKVALNVFLEVQNVLNQNIPSQPSFGLARTTAGEIAEPRQLVQITQSPSSPLPALGIVVDF